MEITPIGCIKPTKWVIGSYDLEQRKECMDGYISVEVRDVSMEVMDISEEAMATRIYESTPMWLPSNSISSPLMLALLCLAPVRWPSFQTGRWGLYCRWLQWWGWGYIFKVDSFWLKMSFGGKVMPEKLFARILPYILARPPPPPTQPGLYFGWSPPPPSQPGRFHCLHSSVACWASPGRRVTRSIHDPLRLLFCIFVLYC